MENIDIDRKNYEAPEIEVLDVEVEKGFATSWSSKDWEIGNNDWFNN